ncbi:MAG: PPOX class F420-dependent oxidoreductase [Anaerolineales bacterium]|nr:PPOX class F420-dependent oxidoreductase [Anaerolineales bacterium]
MVAIPEPVKDLFSRERAITCALATTMADGTPQVTPVWFDYDGTHIIVNTARGRQKDRNMTRQAKVTILIIDPQNAYHWAEVRGVVEDVTEDGAVEVIRNLALKYRGTDRFDLKEGEVRVTYKIAPLKVNGK